MSGPFVLYCLPLREHPRRLSHVRSWDRDIARLSKVNSTGCVSRTASDIPHAFGCSENCYVGLAVSIVVSRNRYIRSQSPILELKIAVGAE